VNASNWLSPQRTVAFNKRKNNKQKEK